MLTAFHSVLSFLTNAVIVKLV